MNLLRSETRIPVFDPEDRNLCLVAISQLDPAKYVVVDIPRLRPEFDIYGSNELDTEDAYSVVTRNEHAQVEKSFIARLHLYRLGWWRAGVLRMAGKRYRRLWIGPMPAAAGLK